MPNEESKRIAEKIANELFTNGWNEKASRIVLELPDNRDGGGRCWSNVVDIIATVLQGA